MAGGTWAALSPARPVLGPGGAGHRGSQDADCQCGQRSGSGAALLSRTREKQGSEEWLPAGLLGSGVVPHGVCKGTWKCPAQESPASSRPTSGLCPAGPQAPRQAAQPPWVGRDCVSRALTVPSPLPDGRAQVRGQHRPGPALALAGGRALQLWPLPEGSLLHAVAGEMRCRLRQEPRGPSAPPELGRPSELPPSGRWRPCPEPLPGHPGLCLSSISSPTSTHPLAPPLRYPKGSRADFPLPPPGFLASADGTTVLLTAQARNQGLIPDLPQPDESPSWKSS